MYHAASHDRDDLAELTLTRRDRNTIADLDVARHSRLDTILDPRGFTRHAILGLQADHGVGRDDQLFEGLLRRLGRTRRLDREALCRTDRLRAVVGRRRRCSRGWRLRR